MANIFTALERMADAVGFDYGNHNSKVQADLLNGFTRGLTAVPYSDNGGPDTQMCYIAEDMTPDARKAIIRLAQFCEPSNE